MKSFGEIIKEKREAQNLLLREVSALTEIDQSIICKFEKGERKPSREQVLKFAEIYNLPKDDLIISWQSDKVAYDLLLENHALEILRVAESKVEYLKTKKK
jgi:transcriptional regulator with XRE-family HTH domain